MAKLVLTLEGDFLAEFPLNKERLTIGRRPNCDVRLENLAISGEHAAVVAADGEFFLEDNQSTNGTLVNGRTVTRHQLQDGDRIGLGRHQIEFREEGLDVERGFEKTVLVMPMINELMAQQAAVSSVSGQANTIRQHAGSEGQLSGSAADSQLSDQLARVTVLSNGRELVLKKTLTTLGRSGVQVAVIARRPHGYFLAHVEGEGRPILNGNAIGTQAQGLADGDIIELAGVSMRFSLA